MLDKNFFKKQSLPSYDGNFIAVSSRVRLARNLSKLPFPGWSQKRDREFALNQMREVISKLIKKEKGYFYLLQDLDPLEKQVLIEEHLISRQHTASSYSGVALNLDLSSSILLNEEDHLRIQAISRGLCLSKMFRLAEERDSFFSEFLPFAFKEEVGFITSCPSNFGTGMRASVMLHLPGLMLGGYIPQLFNSAFAVGYSVRGFYGEETKPIGNLFQISNQSTLGESEKEIIADLEQFVSDIIAQEKNARLRLLEGKFLFLTDQISRSFGLIQSARLMTLDNALNVLSMLLLGKEFKFFNQDLFSSHQEALREIQSGHLQWSEGKQLGEEERNSLRANRLKERFAFLNSPKF